MSIERTAAQIACIYSSIAVTVGMNDCSFMLRCVRCAWGDRRPTVLAICQIVDDGRYFTRRAPTHWIRVQQWYYTFMYLLQ